MDKIRKLLFLISAPMSLFVAMETSVTRAASPYQDLVNQAKAALAIEDEQAFETHMSRLFERVTGFEDSSELMPEGISDEEYIHKMCDYARVSEPIYTQELLTIMRHQTALIAYDVVLNGEVNDLYVRGMTECIGKDGKPLQTSQFMIDGIDWAQKFQAANTEQAARMSQNIKDLVQENPKIKELQILSRLVEFDVREKQSNTNPEIWESNQNSSIALYRAKLVEKAHDGDLNAQLKVAQGLETGDRFHQDNAMAYFWYKRAHENGGGEEAKLGMNRLLPHLTEANLSSIDVWVRRDHRPY